MIDIEKLKAEIGKKLRAAREEKGISQEELASRLGLSKVGYGALERGKNLIGLHYLIAITYILERPITFFLPGFVVTDEERNDPMRDPRFQDIAQAWQYLSSVDHPAARKALAALHTNAMTFKTVLEEALKRRKDE